MDKTAFMFPGQGSQYVGMAASFYEEFKCCRETFEQAERATGVDIRYICFSDNEQINQTEYTQIAMYTAEIAMLRAAIEAGLKCDVSLGLSLGEYSALTTAGIVSFEDGCRIVRQRGILMEQEVPLGKGGMAAVLGMNQEALDEIMKSSDCPMVSVANYNCPGQIVISGEINQLNSMVEKIKDAGARRIVMLNVSGPFHSPMLKGAGEKLGSVLSSISLADGTMPYVSNVTADYVRTTEPVKELLMKQVYSPVRFEQSIRRLISDGVTTFVEIGPGKTLSGFARKIVKMLPDELQRDYKIYNIEKTDDFLQFQKQ